MIEESVRKVVQVTESPLLTVAMPIFNAGHHLRLAVLSIVSQSFGDWELLLIDDGSTDNAIQSISDIHDSRIRIIRDGLNKGLAARLNEAIDMARGLYFARMDQDDVSYPERFAQQLVLLQGDQTLDVIASNAITISEENEMIGLLPCPALHEAICARPWQGFCFSHPIWMGKTAWFRKFRYAIPGPYFCEDQELLLRSYSESKFGSVVETLFAYRVREKRNLPRVLKTRWTFFRIQASHFMHIGQPFYAALSGLVYLALISRDFWWELHYKLLPKKKRFPLIGTEAERSDWVRVLGAIKKDGRCTGCH